LLLKSRSHNGFAVVALDFSGGSVKDTWQSFFIVLMKEQVCIIADI